MSLRHARLSVLKKTSSNYWSIPVFWSPTHRLTGSCLAWFSHGSFRGSMSLATIPNSAVE